MNLGAGTPGGLETQADFHPLDRLHRHDRLGQPAIELLVPLCVRAQAEGDALDANFDDTAQGVARPLRLVDELLDLPVLVGIQGVESLGSRSARCSSSVPGLGSITRGPIAVTYPSR